MGNLNDFMIDASATIIQAVEKIEKNRSRAIVVAKGGKVVGVVSEGDIMRALLRGTDIHAPLADLAMASFKFLTANDRKQAFELMKKHLFTLVPVVDADFRLTGVITLKDIIADCHL